MNSICAFIVIASNIFLILIINKIESYKSSVLDLCKEITINDVKMNLESAAVYMLTHSNSKYFNSDFIKLKSH